MSSGTSGVDPRMRGFWRMHLDRIPLGSYVLVWRGRRRQPVPFIRRANGECWAWLGPHGGWRRLRRGTYWTRRDLRLSKVLRLLIALRLLLFVPWVAYMEAKRANCKWSMYQPGSTRA